MWQSVCHLIDIKLSSHLNIYSLPNVIILQ